MFISLFQHQLSTFTFIQPSSTINHQPTIIKVYTEPMEDGPINLANKTSNQPIVDSNSNQVIQMI